MLSASRVQRLARAAQLRDRQRAALPVPPAARSARQHRRGDPEHAASRLVLPLARGRLPDQGAQARLHADADPSATARATRRCSADWRSPARERQWSRSTPTAPAAAIRARAAGPRCCRPAGARRRSPAPRVRTTNNRMELQAVIEALQALKRPAAGAAVHRFAVRAPRHPRVAAAMEGARLEDRGQQAGQEPGPVAAARSGCRASTGSSGIGCRATPACRATSAAMRLPMPRSMRCLR